MTRARSFCELEQLVLAEVICWPKKTLPFASSLETEDFGEVLHRAAFEAIRNLEARGAEITLLAVVDEMHAVAVARHGAEAVSDIVLVTEIGLLVLTAPGFGRGQPDPYFPKHLRELRTLASQRRILMRAS